MGAASKLRPEGEAAVSQGAGQEFSRQRKHHLKEHRRSEEGMSGKQRGEPSAGDKGEGAEPCGLHALAKFS